MQAKQQGGRDRDVEILEEQAGHRGDEVVLLVGKFREGCLRVRSALRGGVALAVDEAVDLCHS